MGRGPKATISFTYCMARAPSKVGGGPESAGNETLRTEGSPWELGARLLAVTGAASFSWSQASASPSRHTAKRLLLNNVNTNVANWEPRITNVSLILRCLLLFPGAALRRMIQPCDADADGIKSHHGRGKDAHTQNVGSRRDNGGDNKDEQDGITKI